MPLPSGLELINPGTQGWDAPLDANTELLDEKLVNVMTSPKILGEETVTPTAAPLTDSSGGTVTTTIAAISGSGADAAINDALASLASMINKLTADNAALLAKLSKTAGNGVIAN